MSNQNKEAVKKQKKNNNGYVNWWLFRDKGTVAEKRTAKELWNDPAVKKEIEAVKTTFSTKSQSDN